ncbi:MAG: protein kinase [Acutalibacteraceae bacterium]|nr:protein kinase [Acutalibacteraceae bacterium]
MDSLTLINVIEKQVHQPLWGSWYLKERLGAGNFSVVYRAEAQRQKRVDAAAVKIEAITADGYCSTAEKKRYEADMRLAAMTEETELMAQLKECPYIVTFEDEFIQEFTQNGEFEGYLFFIKMELLDSFYSMLRQNNSVFTEKDILKFAEEVAQGIKAIHDLGYIHRDIKLENIFVSPKTGIFKLGDFNVSKQSDTARTVAGTYEYIAPEIFNSPLNRNSYSRQVDIYSFGLCLYVLANNMQIPFLSDGTNKETALQKRLSGEELPSPVNCSQGLFNIIKKACAYDPKDRYHSINDMLSDIRLLNMLSNGSGSVFGYQNAVPFYGSSTAYAAPQSAFVSIEGSLRTVDENSTVYAGAQNNAVQQYTDNNSTVYAGAQNNAVQQYTDNNSTVYAGAQNTAVQQYTDNNSTVYAGAQNTAVQQSTNNNSTVYAGVQNTAVQQYTDNNSTVYAGAQNTAVQQSTNNNSTVYAGVQSTHAADSTPKNNSTNEWTPILRRVLEIDNSLDVVGKKIEEISGYNSQPVNKNILFPVFTPRDNGLSEYRKGMKYFNEQEYEKAFEQFGISAFQHNKNGLRMMGVCYCLGLGTELSPQNAVKAYKRAADNGSTAALYDLAAMYEYGHGFEKDYKKAFKLYSIAAENNCLRAMAKIGEFYFFGKYIPKNQAKAVEYYEKAAEKGDAAAQYNLGMCYYSGNGVEIDYYKAFDLFMKSGNQNYVSAYNGIGICYVTGNGVAKSERTAVYWYDKGARLGNAAAQYNLGLAYYWGNGVEQDKSVAAKLFEKGAKQGHPAAQFRLGVCFYFGSGIEKDLRSAVYWYETAAKNNNANAQFRLGNCYCMGKGVAKNMEKAVYWYEKAAAQGQKEAQKMLDEINN